VDVMPNFKHTTSLVLIEAIQTTGVTILFYGALPHLTILNGLIVSNGLYILTTFGKCIWNSFQLKSRLTHCNIDIWKAVFHFALVVVQGGTMLVYIILFNKTEEWNHWKLYGLILLGVVLTLFGWCAIGLIIHEIKTFDIPYYKECSEETFTQCMICISRIIVFSIGVILISIKLERTTDWKDLFAIFRGDTSVFNSPNVSKYFDARIHGLLNGIKRTQNIINIH
jgi:hypothetical protein